MKISTFRQAQDYLENLIPANFKSEEALKLERIKLLLKALGNPEKNLKLIHVGGTAGKGSTAMILASLLQGQGEKVGLFLSPHLEKITERVQINRANIPDQDFVEEVNFLLEHIDKVAKKGLGAPTYFEALVALAFDYFHKQKVNFALVEVGLGGKLDATNVIIPLLSILTNVGLDHTEILGRTVEKIARDKVGIFKPKIPVVSGATQTSVQKIVVARAQKTSSPLFLLGKDFRFVSKSISLTGSKFDFVFGKNFYPDLKIAPLGGFQLKNGSLALAALLLLEKQGVIKLDWAKVENTLKSLAVPGRLEIVAAKPTTILDGAHNPMKMSSLIDALEKLFPKQKLIFLLSFKKGKNVNEMLKIVEPKAEKIFASQFTANTDMAKNPAISAAYICSLIYKDDLCIKEENLTKAFLSAKNRARETSSLLVVTGSLYLVGEVRSRFYKKGH
ncbi:MAG: folylpolyglutamate synthase/dihydrofolate synthase family protein [bacterium]|nr:folylpolyglutamate synthase/dihydrofolate synthase family protein [bacterium]